MTRTVRALRLDLLHPRAVLATVGGRFRPELYHGGTGSPLRLVEMPAPHRPEGWVRVRPALAGICGSDLKTLKGFAGHSTTISALFGIPRRMVLGHEVVGTVAAAPRDAAVQEGERVVVDPTLSCADKGLDPCRSCRDGHPQICERLGQRGHLTPGNSIGYHADYGGGWSEELVAPAGRVHRVPSGLDDREAVLAEPLAVPVQAVVRRPPPAGARVAVIGPGALGLLAVHALRALTDQVEIAVIGLSSATDALAVGAGADHVLHGTRRDLVQAAAQHLGARVMGNRLSGPVLAGGFDVILDTVGSPQTIDDALRMLRPRGELVLLASSGRQRMDWSLVWTRDLTVRGTYAYGHGDIPPDARIPAGRRHALDAALDVLEQRHPRELVTHVFDLEDRVAALETAAAGPGAAAVRVAFAP